MLNWLLIFVPIAAGLAIFAHGQDTLIFVTSALAIIPLAGWLGHATEHIAHRTGEGVGGLLNATFGNAAELIIAGMALHQGLYTIVKASLTGSIIGNILLVLGASALAGGIRFKVQEFNPTAARSQVIMLTLSAASLIAPAAFHYLAPRGSVAGEHHLSLALAIVLLVTYGLGLWFTLGTHRQYFTGPPKEPVEDAWPVSRAVLVLGVSTALIAWMSELLVGTVEPAAAKFGMTRIFVGVIVVAIVGNAAEHSTAVLVARKDRMDLTLAIAIGSSVQVALFVAPLLVLASYVLAPQPMDLLFSAAEIVAVGLAVAITWQISADGESNWLEGVQLLALYLILALLFYFLPESTGYVGVGPA
jgi:Ca2+:H+ antiporter